MKKSLILALVAVLVFSLAGAAFAFTDTDNHWAKTYINKLVDLKVVNGVSATAFNPDGKVTRAEFAKMLVNAKGLSLETPATATFTDVAKDAWYFPYVEAAVKAKLVEGIGDGKFAPTALVTREQVAKMIVLAAGLKADDTKAINFDDKAQISDWAKGFVAVAADAKLITGYNNKFNPKANATRAEAAKLTYSELVYEGKIIEEAVVDANLLTELNTETAVIGGKSYDLAGTNGDAVDYVIGSQLVTKDAILEDTKVTFTLNASGKISKIVGDAPDYTFVKGEVTSTGDDGDAFVIINDKKVYIDKDDSDYYYAEINEDDEFENKSNDPVATDLLVNKDYLVVYNSKNFATYALKLATSGTIGKLDYKAEDNDGKYLVIDGKKYYFNKTDGDYDVDKLDSNPVVEFLVDGIDYTNLDAGDRIEFDTNSDDEITALKTSSYDLEGITNIPVVKAIAGGYTVYLPIKVKSSDNFDTIKYLYTDITDDDEVSAIDDMIDDEVIDQVYTLPVGTKVELDTDAKTYITGVKSELYDVKKSSYVVVDLNDDATQKATKVTATAKLAFGIVESIEKSSDKVASVTIAGTKYTYDGDSDKYASSSKGRVSVITVGTGNQPIEVGYLAIATLDADGNIISFSKLVDGDDFDATVSAKAGQLSHFSDDADDSKKVYVPENVVEVQLSNGTYAWVAADKNADDSVAEAANVVDATEVDGKTSSISIKGAKDFAGFEVGAKAYVLLTSDAAINENTSNVFDTAQVTTDKKVRYNSDTNVLTILNADDTVNDTYQTLTGYVIYQK